MLEARTCVHTSCPAELLPCISDRLTPALLILHTAQLDLYQARRAMSGILRRACSHPGRIGMKRCDGKSWVL